jgi:hypothetical protein
MTDGMPPISFTSGDPADLRLGLFAVWVLPIVSILAQTSVRFSYTGFR